GRQHPHAGLAHQAADPRELHGLEARLRLLAVEERRRRHAAIDQAVDGAVLGRDVVEVVGGADAAAADHVLHHDVGIAGHIFGHVARDQPAVLVVAAAGRGTGDQRQLALGAKEFVGRLRLGGSRWDEETDEKKVEPCHACAPLRVPQASLKSQTTSSPLRRHATSSAHAWTQKIPGAFAAPRRYSGWLYAFWGQVLRAE